MLQLLKRSQYFIFRLRTNYHTIRYALVLSRQAPTNDYVFKRGDYMFVDDFITNDQNFQQHSTLWVK